MSAAARWIDTGKALREALRGLGAGPLAIDTEADSLHHYPEKICLIQLSFAEVDLLVDPLAELDLQPLFERLEDDRIVTVLHGADYDLRMLDRGWGARVRGLFDTMIAARLCGEERFGLAHLLESAFGVRMDKRFQRADWSKRPLSEEMARYASMDTHYLLELRTRLLARLDELGRRAWADEEFERLEGVRATPRADGDDGFRRVKGAGKLERKRLAVLRELWKLREEEAVTADRPPFRVMHDERLVDLARRAPKRVEELADVARLPRPWRSGRRAARLVEAVRRGLAVPPDEWPRRGGKRRSRPTGKVDPRVARLRDVRDGIAKELALDPGLVAPRAVLEQIVERRDAGRDPGAAPDLRRWQWELLGPAFRAALG